MHKSSRQSMMNESKLYSCIQYSNAIYVHYHSSLFISVHTRSERGERPTISLLKSLIIRPSISFLKKTQNAFESSNCSETALKIVRERVVSPEARTPTNEAKLPCSNFYFFLNKKVTIFHCSETALKLF